MKKVFLISALSLATLMSNAHAADTTLLKVKGLLTNAACTPALDQVGVADYGRIYLGDLSSTATNQLGKKKCQSEYYLQHRDQSGMDADR